MESASMWIVTTVSLTALVAVGFVYLRLQAQYLSTREEHSQCRIELARMEERLKSLEVDRDRLRGDRYDQSLTALTGVAENLQQGQEAFAQWAKDMDDRMEKVVLRTIERARAVKEILP